MADEATERPGVAFGRSRRGPRVSRLAAGIAATILMVLFLAYGFSMSPGAMDHTMSDAALASDEAAGDAGAPQSGGQMVMSDGSTMDMGEHGVQSPDIAATEADAHASAPVEGEHEMAMGGSVNWYAIGIILALVSTSVAVAAGLKEHLERRIATGALVTAPVTEVCGE